MDQRPHEVEQGGQPGADRPDPLRADAVGELARRHREEERRDPGDGESDADLRRRQADDLREEDGRAGDEGALADREEDRLDRQRPGQAGDGGSWRCHHDCVVCASLRSRCRPSRPMVAEPTSVRRVSFLRPSDEPSVAIRQLSRWLEADTPAPLLIETSGSTGRPKGVVLPRRAVLASVEASARRLGASGRWLLALPSSYVAGVQVIVRSLVAGHEPFVVDGLDVGRAAAADHTDTPTFVSLVPTQLHRIMADPEQVAALARCHTVLVGGAGLDPDLRRRAEERGRPRWSRPTAPRRPPAGASTTACRSTASASRSARRGASGSPGPTLFSHYDDDPDLTAETVVDGWFLTSDAGRFDEDGRLQDRRSHRRRRDQRRREDPAAPRSPSGCASHLLVAAGRGLRRARPRVGAAARRRRGRHRPRGRAARLDQRGAPDGRGRRASSAWVEQLPLLPNGKVDRQAIRAGL